MSAPPVSHGLAAQGWWGDSHRSNKTVYRIEQNG
jgi:hypothetical protein